MPGLVYAFKPRVSAQLVKITEYFTGKLLILQINFMQSEYIFLTGVCTYILMNIQ